MRSREPPLRSRPARIQVASGASAGQGARPAGDRQDAKSKARQLQYGVAGRVLADLTFHRTRNGSRRVPILQPPRQSCLQPEPPRMRRWRAVRSPPQLPCPLVSATGRTLPEPRRPSSCLFQPCDAIQRNKEVLPQGTFARQTLASRRRQPVVASPALARLFNPAAVHQPFVLKAVQSRVERCDVITECAPRLLFDESSDFVAVLRPLFKKGQYQQIRGPFLKFLREYL